MKHQVDFLWNVLRYQEVRFSIVDKSENRGTLTPFLPRTPSNQ